MNTVILARPSKTAKELSKSLDIPLYRHGENVPYNTELVIRYGNTDRLNFDVTELNQREAIITSSNKPLTRIALEAFGVPVPLETETDFPIIARTKHHEGGSGFYYCNDEYELESAKEHDAVYFSKFYPKTAEYRVHIANNKTLLVSIKEGGNYASPIWNYKRTGFTLRHLYRHVWLEDEDLLAIVKLAKKALRILSLDFGAVDIMAFPKDNQPEAVISEVNTCPSLSPLALSKYIDYLASIIYE